MSKKTSTPTPYGLQYPLTYDAKDKEIVAAYHVTNFIERIMSAFKWEGLPDTIPQRFLERYLLMNGQCYVTEVNGNLYALAGTLGGEPDPYYLPKLYVVANPALGNLPEYNRETDGVLVMNDDLMVGVLPIISRYSTALAEHELTINIADINMRLAFILSSGDDAAKKSAEEFIKQIAKGNMGVIGDSAFLEGIKVQPGIGSTATGYMSQLLEYEQYLKASCYNELGIDLNFNMKREAITAGETSQNEPALRPLIDNMLKCREESAEALNKKYGLNVSVELASAWSIEKAQQEQTIKEPTGKDGDDENNDSDGEDEGNAETE